MQKVWWIWVISYGFLFLSVLFLPFAEITIYDHNMAEQTSKDESRAEMIWIELNLNSVELKGTEMNGPELNETDLNGTETNKTIQKRSKSNQIFHPPGKTYAFTVQAVVHGGLQD